MVLKPKMTAAELSRYLLGACGKIITQGYRFEKCLCATDIRSRLLQVLQI